MSGKRQDSGQWQEAVARLTAGKGGWHLSIILISLIAVIAVGLAVRWLFRRATADIQANILNAVQLGKLQFIGQVLSRMVLDAFGVGIYVLTTFLIFSIFYREGTPSYVIVSVYLIISYYIAVLAFGAKAIFSPKAASLRLFPMEDRDAAFLYNWILRIIFIAGLFAGIGAIFQQFGVSDQLYFQMYSSSGLVVILAMVIMVWQSRNRVAQAICDEDMATWGGTLRTAFSRNWHYLAILYVIVAGGIWTAKALDIEIGRMFTRSALSIVLILLVSFIAWQLIKARIDQKLKEEMPDDDEEAEEGGAGGSRMGTLLVLLRKFVLAVMFVMVSLIILASLGVNIGPLIAGAGVIGLAIGFGAQTLVKDIIAGVFFLIDDAFRVGDFIENGGTKGMVEHISLRSLRLRNPRGPVHTIPFGSMGTVTNNSRDYIISKLDFRVRYDTDVDKVRKIIKKINKKIMKDPEMGPVMLDKIKSQGVRELDDSAMIMRVKFKTIPGEQFVIRREVFRMMQESFRENGIEFAHRNVTVYLAPGEEANESSKKAAEAGAAAAAAVQAEEEQLKQQQKAK